MQFLCVYILNCYISIVTCKKPTALMNVFIHKRLTMYMKKRQIDFFFSICLIIWLFNCARVPLPKTKKAAHTKCRLLSEMWGGMGLSSRATKLPKKKESEHELRPDSVWCERRDLTVCGAAHRILLARVTPRFACGTALALSAKNVPPAHFLNAETLPGSSPQNKKSSPHKV